MEKEDMALQPMEYDGERLIQFRQRATYWTNLPKEYKPGHDANLAAFADAIIGFYIDSLDVTYEDDPAGYQVGLARAAFALDFLQGVSPTELTQKFATLEPTEGGVRIPRDYALGVAGIGGRHFRHLAGETAPKPVKTETPAAELETKVEAVDERDYCDFIHLGASIRKLHEEDRIGAGEAQALLLLFRQAQSPARKEIQVRVIESTAQHLKARLKRAMALQPHKGESIADEAFIKGAVYVRNVAERPAAMLTDNRVFVDLVKADMIMDDSLTPQEAYERIRGHIGYVLDKIY